MNRSLITLVFSLLSLTVARSADLPRFEIRSEQMANLVLEATPGKPWILIITLTEKALKKYHDFTVAHLGDQISLVVAGTEIYQPRISIPVSENPITFRMYQKDKYLAILSALPDDPQ